MPSFNVRKVFPTAAGNVMPIVGGHQQINFVDNSEQHTNTHTHTYTHCCVPAVLCVCQKRSQICVSISTSKCSYGRVPTSVYYPHSWYCSSWDFVSFSGMQDDKNIFYVLLIPVLAHIILYLTQGLQLLALPMIHVGYPKACVLP